MKYNNYDKIIYEPGDWLYRKTNKKYFNGRDCIIEFVFKIDKIDQDPIGRPVYCFDNFNCVRYDNKAARHKSGYFNSADACEEFRAASQKEIDEATKIIEEARRKPSLIIAGHQVKFDILPNSIYASRVTIGCKILTYGRILNIRSTMIDYGLTGLQVTGRAGESHIITFQEVEILTDMLNRAKEWCEQHPTLHPTHPPIPEDWKHAPACDVKRSV